MDPETLYRQFGRLIESCPDFSGYGPLETDQLKWLGLACALVGEAGDLINKVEIGRASKLVQTPARADALKSIMLVLYKELALAELKAPPGVQGAFIPAGNAFDAFTAITKVLQSATADIFIVDPYMDKTLLTDFCGVVAANVDLRLMSDVANVKATLAPAAQAWKAQHQNNRPLSVRLAPARALHDRAVFIDKTTAWLLTQSFKDFAKKSPAELVRANDTASLKIAAYESMWSSATVIV